MPMGHPHIWVRHEARSTERRCPVTPDSARRLVEAGARVTVEESTQRIFPLDDYVAAGAETAPTGSWVDAPEDAFVLGLKELPEEPARLRHRHIYFGHAFKGQAEAPALLQRFRAGGGTLLALEYLVAGDGRRVAAFGYWAGYLGAALGVLQSRGALPAPLTPTTREELDASLRAGAGSAPSRALVTGALLDHALLVHCVLTTPPSEPFVRGADVPAEGRRLSLLVDVTCDTSHLTLLPVYQDLTSWEAPVSRLADAEGGRPPLDVIAIDNLPSLLPLEASRTYAEDLFPTLLTLVTEGDVSPVWARARTTFEQALATTPAT